MHRLSDGPNGHVLCEYTPTIVGEHIIEIFYIEQPINGSPFKAKVWDAGQVEVHITGNGRPNKPFDFIGKLM